MHFPDEPPAGENLPILPGHVSHGRLERVLRAGGFAVTAELAPPDSADPTEVYARAAVFDGYGGRDKCNGWLGSQLPYVQCGNVFAVNASRVRHGDAGLVSGSQ